MYSENGATLFIGGGTMEIWGNAPAHMMVSANGIMYNTYEATNHPALTISAAVTIGNFAAGYSGGYLSAIYKSIVGAANVTGSQNTACPATVFSALAVLGQAIC